MKNIQVYKRLNRILEFPKGFAFQLVSKDEVKRLIKDLKNSKSVVGEIPIKVFERMQVYF